MSDAHDRDKAEWHESQLPWGEKFPKPSVDRLKELALDPAKTWMEKYAPEILEEEDRLELREQLERQQKDRDA